MGVLSLAIQSCHLHLIYVAEAPIRLFDEEDPEPLPRGRLDVNNEGSSRTAQNLRSSSSVASKDYI